MTRRTGLAIATGFAAYVSVRLAVRGLRQNLVPAIHALLPLPRGPQGIFHAWEIDHGFTDSHGRPIPYSVVAGCFQRGAHLSLRCMMGHHVYQSFVYDPASRFWPLQAAEAGLFIALAAILLTTTVWWVIRRIGH
ncbi:MAG TPA: hypothetical protein VKV27_09820 [Solirubrobacteraceae bacterium]|nr:hypothetical protein [Solirubrobacteraceae bacterium]